MDKELLKGCKSVSELYGRLLEAERLIMPQAQVPLINLGFGPQPDDSENSLAQIRIEFSLNLLLARLVIRNSSKSLLECLDEQIIKVLPEAKDLYLLREPFFSEDIPLFFGVRVAEIAIYELYQEQENCSHRAVNDYLISVGMPSGLRDKVRNTDNQRIRQYADNLKQMYKENGWSLEFLIANYKMHKEKNSGKTSD